LVIAIVMLHSSPLHRVHRVFVVDDSLDVREAMACLLRVHGWRVVTAGSGREAFEAFERGLRPCIMLLDLSMPDMSGWEVWDRMRAHEEWQSTPVVIVSGDVPDMARAQSLGIRAFLQKPRLVPEVVDVVERHCRVANHGAGPAPRAVSPSFPT
jgi:CheY-like chemotaxis protein